jgi:hypothetical protein
MSRLRLDRVMALFVSTWHPCYRRMPPPTISNVDFFQPASSSKQTSVPSHRCGRNERMYGPSVLSSAKSALILRAISFSTNGDSRTFASLLNGSDPSFLYTSPSLKTPLRMTDRSHPVVFTFTS